MKLMNNAIDSVNAVLNQSTPLLDDDRYHADLALREATARYGAGWAHDELGEAGQLFASSRLMRLAVDANRFRPELKRFDAQGRRIDRVDFHPAWHELLGCSIERGIVSMPWDNPRPGSQVARAALFYLYSQTETGTQCPIAMSTGTIQVLERLADQLPEIGDLWLPKLKSRSYDGRFMPARDKSGVLFGMGMTERQGGSDVRRNITRARALDASGPGRRYAITGHKWFFSAPMSDAFLILAQTSAGIACFLVPRFLEDGELNALHLVRLKDKLGNHSNASSELELHGATGYLLGDEGRGIHTIIEMATHTRLDCVLATAGMQRRALCVALNHAGQREAFGARLIDQPIMAAVLAELAIESEAATVLAMFLAHCFAAEASDGERLIGRLLTPAAKFHVCKRGPQFAAEAMEVLGGNGYIEELDLARIYREMPLLSIWEGSGNVMCLDVLRVLSHEHESRAVLLEFVRKAHGENAAFDAYIDQLDALLQQAEESDGRRVAHAITLAIQGSLLIRHAPACVADTFCATRLLHEFGNASFGVLPRGAPVKELLARAWP
ncbi:MAG TPA: isovaleryl-CoA dehydrogenase [Woeseiaceae bacterium]|nr:isovaleryl-CoA dehydrogenase [Woeseiaceae bacterium]